uniref:F5/8 type C domain-containing protein n=1 Tax=Human herpesvirus 2 TaxID=10310 RepID=A0A481TIG8_HHV2|nr:hypothetical protein [Human alphaherpesvirus 2]
MSSSAVRRTSAAWRAPDDISTTRLVDASGRPAWASRHRAASPGNNWVSSTVGSA